MVLGERSAHLLSYKVSLLPGCLLIVLGVLRTVA
jgi:hypothetical protein